jgi:hypothetical protein
MSDQQSDWAKRVAASKGEKPKKAAKRKPAKKETG